MKYTSKLGLPIWNKPETDVFDIEQFNEGMQAVDDIVVNILNQINDLVIGDKEIDLNGYIKEEVFKELKKKVANKADKEEIETINSQMDTITNDKISKGEGGIITNAMLSQEVKEAMTGGSVAVVGNDGVASNNIISKSITQSLLSPKLREQLTLDEKKTYTLNPLKGYYTNSLTYEENNNYTTIDPLECYLGDEFIVNHCVSGQTAYYCCLLDKNKQPIEVINNGDGSSIATEKTYKINNANARYVVFTTSTGRVSSLYVKKVEVKNINKYITTLDNSINDIKSILSKFKEIPYTENTNNGYYNSKGSFVATTSSTNYRNTELLECSYGDEFEFQSYGIGTSAYQVVEFDVNRLPLGAYLQGNGSSNSYTIKNHTVINKETKYIAFSYYIGDLILTKKILIDKLSSAATSVNDILNEKTIVGLGDSLMYGMGLDRDKPWIALLGKKYNMNYFNCGVNGKKIAGSDGVANEFETLLTTNKVPTNIDYIVIDGGANDNAQGIQIGKNTDMTIDTFKGALNILIGKILNKYPTVKILFLTNYNRYPGDINFVNAMIEICELYSIPCFDNYRKSGINFLNPNGYHTSRNLIFENQQYKKHFSAKGYEYLLPIYENLLKGI